MVLEEVIENSIQRQQNDYPRQQNHYQLQQHSERNNPLSYTPPFTYQERFQKERRDIFRVTPFASLQRFPRQGNEGLYGWTARSKNGTIHLRGIWRFLTRISGYYLPISLQSNGVLDPASNKYMLKVGSIKLYWRYFCPNNKKKDSHYYYS